MSVLNSGSSGFLNQVIAVATKLIVEIIGDIIGIKGFTKLTTLPKKLPKPIILYPILYLVLLMH